MASWFPYSMAPLSDSLTQRQLARNRPDPKPNEFKAQISKLEDFWFRVAIHSLTADPTAIMQSDCRVTQL